MASPQMNVGVASNDRRMFEIICPTSARLFARPRPSCRVRQPVAEDERKKLAKLHGTQLSEALTRAIEGY